MPRRAAPLLCAFALWAAPACSDSELAEAQPRIRLSASSLDFGDVRLGFYRLLSIAVYNDGSGWLNLSDVALADGSSEGFRVWMPPLEVAPGSYVELKVEYAPTHEGSDHGTVRISSDDAASPSVDLFVEGGGVLPQVAVDPSLVYFPTSIEGTQSQEVRIASVGSGALTVHDVSLEAGEAAFAAALPDAVSLPFELEPGLILSVTVTFSAGDGLSHADRLLVSTDDPDHADALWPVELVAAGEPPDGENQPPRVEITSPADGSAAAAGADLLLVGQVADPDDPPDSLAILWHSDVDDYFGTGIADASGVVSLSASALTPATHTITLYALDPEGASGSDSISLLVWDEDDEFTYTLSGGETPYHFWHVDDDVEVQLNGVPILVDDNDQQDSHAPLDFVARPGDVLRVVARDERWCTRALDGLWLHFEGGAMQELTEAVSVSACDDHPDYDPAYEGPWPNVFLDQSFGIAIP